MAKYPRHKSFLARLVHRAPLFDVGVALAVLVAGAITVCRDWGEKKDASFWSELVAITIAFLFAAGKGVLEWYKLDHSESPHDLAGCLHTIHSQLLGACGDVGSVGLRITIHVPINNGSQLEQALEYIGDSRARGRAGRCFPAQSGIIGRAFREKDLFFANRTTNNTEEYVKELVTEWRYTEQDARARDSSAQSWMAIPLVSADSTGEPKGPVEAVVYFDSTERGFFDSPERQKIASYGCVGIAQFARQRYK